eukprot:scaffold10074_cov98-Isochrysis_galbana.AAC.2
MSVFDGTQLRRTEADGRPLRWLGTCTLGRRAGVAAGRGAPSPCAVSAEFGLLDNGDRFAKCGGKLGRCQAGGTATNNEEIVRAGSVRTGRLQHHQGRQRADSGGHG